MAAVSTLQYGRQKKSAYGTAGKTSWNTTFFDDSDDEPSAPTPAPAPATTPAPTPKPVRQRSGSVKESHTVQKVTVKQTPSLRTTKPNTAKQDTFDVPSSDDEASRSPNVIQRHVFQAKRSLVDDRGREQTQLAPWERQRPTREIAPDNDRIAKRRTVSSQQQTTTASTSAKGNIDGTSAAARLAARKRIAEPSVPSPETPLVATRTATYGHGGTSGEKPRKRARTGTLSHGKAAHVVMADRPSPPRCESTASRPPVNDVESGVYDFPDSSDDESAKPRKRTRSPRTKKKPARRTNPVSSSSEKSIPRKGLSAPARLAEMLPADSDVTEPSARSPSATTSRGQTPQPLSTPPSRQRRSPDATIRSGGHLTPKQAQLWNRLLPSQQVAPSPSALAMQDLAISEERRKSSNLSSVAKRLTESQSNIHRRRTRLVDRLKASAQASSDGESSDASSDIEDTVMSDSTEVPVKPSIPRMESTEAQITAPSTSRSQSRSQSSAPIAGGLKRTYASQRSHLAEDSFEDGLLAGLIDDTPKPAIKRSRTFVRSQSTTQKDAFDFDDSGDDAPGTGAIRSIHELRAAGRSIRGTEDIEQLLEEVENHSASYKGRRRSALIELATKLVDKNFASRFVGQGCDLRLARQCADSGDPIADFVLAAAVTLLLASDPPEHTVRTLHDSGVVSWLATLLLSADEISRVAKDRKSNTAKASQTSLLKLAELLLNQQALWADERLDALSTRLVALKALDLLVGKLRRSGDKSELLGGSELKLLLLDTNGTEGPYSQDDTSLSISLLESLSTAALALAWDRSILQRIVETLTSLDARSRSRRHTLFLTLRLCLNLTTDNPGNCALLATESSVQYLLQTVQDGFTTINTETEEEKRTLALDFLVLALGILINLFEHSPAARTHASASAGTGTAASWPLVPSLVQTFTAGQRRMLDAASVEESVSNVALGYLAVMLANLCQDADARRTVAATLSLSPRDGEEEEAGSASAAAAGPGLRVLADAVEEFVLYHQQVDGMNFEGAEGGAVWGAFTEKLRLVLERVREVESL